MLLANDIPDEKVSIVNIKPSEFVSVLQSGKVDGIVSFPPHTEQIQTFFGKRITAFFGEDLHTSRYNLIAKQDYLAKHPEVTRKMLKALARAIQYAADNPAQAYEIVGKYLKLDTNLVAKIFKIREFELALEQPLLPTLEDETRWAMKRGFVKTGPIPNYLDYLDLDPLLSFDPNAVKIIH